MTDKQHMEQHSRSMLSEAFRDLLPFTSLGWQLVATILACFAVGYLLDRWLATKPVWTIVMSIVGVVTGLVSFIKMALALTQRRKNDSQ
jgi:F0F1-type ATP synthase assembly protein I